MRVKDQNDPSNVIPVDCSRLLQIRLKPLMNLQQPGIADRNLFVLPPDSGLIDSAMTVYVSFWSLISYIELRLL